MNKKTVIYTRFSLEMQRTDSCSDQERKAREGLGRLGIDHRQAEVMRSEAESGTRADRAEYLRLRRMIEDGEVAVLAVDDQARLSRGDDVFSLIQDLVFAGGRFISVGEGIDTEREGWELQVKTTEVHNSTTICRLGSNVRRGQEGRVLDGNGSAGDFSFGYRSVYLDPNWAEWTGRGPRPKKIVVIYEPEAVVVRTIFSWFAAGESISEIVRRLNARGVDKGPRSWKSGWHHQTVRRILSNQKYVGLWSWGRTRTLRNSQGKKRQVPASEEKVVETMRPDLRIIDDGTWQQAQKRLRELNDKYGKKSWQKSRKSRVHWTELYPASLLSRLIDCSQCGSGLVIQVGGGRKYLGCPSHRKGRCDMATRVRVDVAEKAITECVGELLKSEPGWLDAAVKTTHRVIGELSSQVPTDLAADDKRLGTLERQINSLVNALAEGQGESAAVMARVQELERERDAVLARVDEQRAVLAKPVELPGGDEIRARLADLGPLLRSELPQSAQLLRKLLGRVTAHHIHLPGKKRGYAQLRFQISGLAALKTALSDRLPMTVIDLAEHTADQPATRSAEIRIDLGKPTRMDRLAPEIAALRGNGVAWKKIVELTGLSLGNAYTAWKRWVDDQEAHSDAA